jgi:Flp pilus assembly protein TadD
MSLRLSLFAGLMLLALGPSALQAGPVPTQGVRPLPTAGSGDNQALQQGLAALQAKQPEEARKAFVAALRASPQSVEAMLGMAELGFQARNDAEALKWLQQAERTAPQRADVQTSLGRFFMARQQADKAEAALRKAVQLDAKALRPRLDLAELLLNRQASKEALPLLREAVQIEPKNALTHYGLGVALLNGGTVVEGEASLRKSAELDPKNPAPWLMLARIQRSGAAAEPFLEQALLRDPKNFDALMLRAQWQAGDKDPKTLRDTLQKAAQANTKVAEPWVRLALLDEAAGKRSDARRNYMAAIERDPHQPIALNNLVMMGLADGEDPSRLETMARRAVKALPNNAQVLDTLAQTLRARKDKKGALDAGVQAAKLAPKDVGIQLHVAELYQWNGDRAAARTAVETVLALQPKGKEADKARELLTRL